MDTQEFMNMVYDILAQNPVAGVYGMKGREHDYITGMVDHVDTGNMNEQHSIIFNAPDGSEYELKLIQTYAPARGNI